MFLKEFKVLILKWYLSKNWDLNNGFKVSDVYLKSEFENWEK